MKTEEKRVFLAAVGSAAVGCLVYAVLAWMAGSGTWNPLALVAAIGSVLALLRGMHAGSRDIPGEVLGMAVIGAAGWGCGAYAIMSALSSDSGAWHPLAFVAAVGVALVSLAVLWD